MNRYTSDGLIRTVAEGIGASGAENIALKGLSGSLDAILIAACKQLKSFSSVIILENQEDAAYFQNDLQNLLNREILLFPMSHKRPYEFTEIENANVLLRTEVLTKISSAKDPFIVVTYPEALSEKVITKRTLSSNTLTLRKNESISLPDLQAFLSSCGFEKSDFVYEAGQYSIRGGIVDIFSFALDVPYRIEFLGNEIEDIRSFDPASQLSIEALDRIVITPNLQTAVLEKEYQSFLEFIPGTTRLWFKDVSLTTDLIQKSFERVEARYAEVTGKNSSTSVVLSPGQLYETGQQFRVSCEKFFCIEFGKRFELPATKTFTFSSTSQPSFNKNFELLAEDLEQHSQKGFSCFVASEIPKQLQRLTEIFSEINPDIAFTPLDFALREGFIDRSLNVLCYTDHQIFERFHRYHARERFSKSKAMTLKELQAMVPGDFIVHIDYGIGKFAGLEKKEVNGRSQEFIRLVYRDDDLLYINIHALHKISKYSGRDGAVPVITKLGSQEWESKKSKAKSKVKDIAKELIALYAKRKKAPGFSYSRDSYLQAELESSFLYEDTPDQSRASDDVKRDLEQPHPMDRLVCGDVGFGKTEVAVRAAFKVIQDKKQVAVLVPTTILAMQHHRTFSDRLQGFGIHIEYISRFKTTKEITEILNRLRGGKIDLIIGTHRLVSKDVQFHDLGLLIIDEEQKFGVKVKERLKEFKVNVDALTLTATPIPRTLQFSLMGARDLSIIATPPLNRQPVTTELHTFNEVLIRDSVSFELRRGGQVFFVHNRVSDIEEVANIIHRLVPDAKIGIAHGQMDGPQLEKVMVRFINGEYDVLVSTNIIESGLDIPNANTIIINQAHTFGLSDLHQMRGRVGRSNKKAFCYLLTPPTATLSSDSRKRLAALEEFSDLGDGFKVAMRDLDIRGAGNLLGAEQTGFINDLGFDTYHKILDDAIQELKETDFRELFAPDLQKQAELISQDCVIETDLELLIPEDYVSNITERLQLYARLDTIKDETQLLEFTHELEDRFGTMPQPVVELTDSVRVRWMAEKLGFEKILMKGGRLRGYFLSGKADYFNSEVFGKILVYIQTHPRQCKLAEKGNKPFVTIDNCDSVANALRLFETILQVQSPSREILSR